MNSEERKEKHQMTAQEKEKKIDIKEKILTMKKMKEMDQKIARARETFLAKPIPHPRMEKMWDGPWPVEIVSKSYPFHRFTYDPDPSYGRTHWYIHGTPETDILHTRGSMEFWFIMQRGVYRHLLSTSEEIIDKLDDNMLRLEYRNNEHGFTVEVIIELESISEEEINNSMLKETFRTTGNKPSEILLYVDFNIARPWGDYDTLRLFDHPSRGFIKQYAVGSNQMLGVDVEPAAEAAASMWVLHNGRWINELSDRLRNGTLSMIDHLWGAYSGILRWPPTDAEYNQFAQYIGPWPDYMPHNLPYGDLTFCVGVCSSLFEETSVLFTNYGG